MIQEVLRVNQIKIPINVSEKTSNQEQIAKIEKKLRKIFNMTPQDYIKYECVKKSVDSRHKPELYYVYSVEISEIHIKGKVQNLEKLAQRHAKDNAIFKKVNKYEFPAGNVNKSDRPVIIGFGPAGMFAALELSRAGMTPIVFERGESVENRQKRVSGFWNGDELNEESNVQFGEGGAGTFSDGKLNSVIKDPTGMVRHVLETFAEFGADSSITYDSKPHIGTDVLAVVVKNIRQEILRLGGEIHFNHKMTDVFVENGKVTGIEVVDNESGVKKNVKCSKLCLSIGHSARDTFYMLGRKNIYMEPKPFAVGLRIQHPQSFIDENAYGNCSSFLPAASYKVTHQTETRGVYSFCMCPGGYVVNASSEKESLAVNGMSYSDRGSLNANSAMVVTVSMEDFGKGVFDGIEFQRKMERLAYREGKGNIPVQLFKDFETSEVSSGFGRVEPCIKGGYSFGNLRNVLPEFVSTALVTGIHGCSRYIKGFDMEDALLAGVESRTSSPVKIKRDDNLNSVNVKGIYPCGEGAGYAGGITSAAVDGIRVAEKIFLNMDF